MRGHTCNLLNHPKRLRNEQDMPPQSFGAQELWTKMKGNMATQEWYICNL